MILAQACKQSLKYVQSALAGTSFSEPVVLCKEPLTIAYHCATALSGSSFVVEKVETIGVHPPNLDGLVAAVSEDVWDFDWEAAQGILALSALLRFNSQEAVGSWATLV